jgi:sugar phosphate isomerase/epimerase
MTDEKSIGETFEKLVKMGYTEGQTAGGNVELPAFAELAKKYGMAIVGTHYDFGKIVNAPAATMKLHDTLGTKNVGIGGMPGDARTSYDALMKFIETFNKAAEVYAKEGFKLTYHNHSFEYTRINEDKTIMDYLYEGFDKDNVSFVLDTCWVAHGGADVRYWMEKLAGRIDILHLKDLQAYYDNSGKVATRLKEIGNGNLWWDGIIETAEKIGVKHYIVEQDNNWIDGCPFKALEFSKNTLAKYIK